MCVAFAAAPEQRAADYAAAPGHHPAAALFILVFLLYISYAVGGILAGSARSARQVKGCMRASLLLIAFGCSCCLAYAVVKAADTIAPLVGRPIPEAFGNSVGRLLVAVGATLVMSGSAVVPMAQRLGAARTWAREYVACRQLYRLWFDLAAAVPFCVFEPPSGWVKDALRLRLVHESLYRRLIQMRDCWMDLRPWFDADVVDRQEPRMCEGAPDDHAAEQMAAVLHQAVAIVQAGVQPDRLWVAPVPEHTTMDGELEWWLNVAAMWRRQRRGPTTLTLLQVVPVP
jgi:hypothetical protein